MANIKSQKKRIITAEKARQRNKAVRSELKTYVMKVRVAAESGDKAASKGIIHKNQAAERKSGIQHLVNSME